MTAQTVTLPRELVEQSINILQKTYLSSYSSEMKRRDIVIELQNALMSVTDGKGSTNE